MTGSTGSGESIDSLLDAAADAITRGELTAAYEAARRAAGIAPEAPRVWLTVGAVLHAGGRLDDALDTFVRAHGLAPDDPDIASARAAVLMELGRPEEARAVLQIARDAHPGHARLAVNLAYACEACGDPDAALALLDAVLARLSSGADPARRAALKSRTALYLALRRTPEAWRDANTLVELQPDDADAQFNLAEAALAAGEPEAALAAANHALERRPAHVYAAIDRALALAVLGDFDAASDALDAARAIDPERFDAYRNADRPMVAGTLRDADPMRIWFEAAYERAFVCDWRRSAGFEERLAALVDAGAGQPLFRQESVPFRVLALDWPPTRHAAIARAAAAGVAARAEALPRMEAVPREDRSRIRIGYVSADFREHPMAWLTRHLYALHDRRRFEVYGYALHADDADDGMSREIGRACDVARRLSMDDPAAAAQTIRADGIDILIDLGGFTLGARPELFALRPAPVQVAWLGYPASTGAPWIDYVLADAIVLPPTLEPHWTEHPVRLPGAYLMADPVAAAKAPAVHRTAFALPESAIVLCAFHNGWKIRPPVFDVWMEVLRAVPDAVLWCLDQHPEMAVNLRREAAARGVAAERLIFSPRCAHDRHLGRLRLADIYLDTWTANGHTTAVDALLAGVPAVLRVGESFAGRVSASLVSALGLPDWISADADGYRERALALARDAGLRLAERQRLADRIRESRAFDPLRKTKQIEAAYGRMWSRHRAGEPPAAIDLTAQTD